MASWRKHLRRMVADPKARAYTYEQGAVVLEHLGFTNEGGRGSHRKFRLELDDPGTARGKRAVIVGLVQKGSGTLKPVYIEKMIETLRDNGLLPSDIDENDEGD